MITKQYFGTLEDGREVHCYTMKNEAGVSVRISDLGGAVMELRVPDKYGRLSDIVEGYDSVRDYVLDTTYAGGLIGRVGNRICKGKFNLEGKEYQIACNNNENSLHGGNIGFSHKIWNVQPIDGEEPKLLLSLISPDGDENYPGTLTVNVTYTLLRSNALSIRYEATTDQTTVVNLTNHTYFNLGGYASGKIFDHVLQMDADAYLPTDDTLIPTGEIRSVAGSPFDFREPKTIGKDFDLSNEDMRLAGGYDHCFCFRDGASKEPILRIEVFEPNSGRLMQVYTDQPCVQFYSGNFLKNPNYPLKNGYPQNPQAAFCLETQKMPDAVNHPNFTDTILHPGEVYTHTTIYQFSVR